MNILPASVTFNLRVYSSLHESSHHVLFRRSRACHTRHIVESTTDCAACPERENKTMLVHNRSLVYQMTLLAFSFSIILPIPLSTIMTLTCLTTLDHVLAPTVPTAVCGPSGYDHKQKAPPVSADPAAVAENMPISNASWNGGAVKRSESESERRERRETQARTCACPRKERKREDWILPNAINDTLYEPFWAVYIQVEYLE
ncbi:hypothetical protein BC827DRAFT_633534 [Russula dissimulans]|nr:hypothetical protein BC827DRAFT_633534 [Russula dissimulans]